MIRGVIVVSAVMHLTKYLVYLLYKASNTLPTLADHSSIILSSTASSVNGVAMRTAE